MLIRDNANGWMDAEDFDQDETAESVMHGGDLGVAISRFLTQDQVTDHQIKSPLASEVDCSEAESQEPEKLYTIPFIVYKDGVYSLTTNASDRLSSISTPPCIVTVFGEAKSGKSTLVVRSLYALDTSSEDAMYTVHEDIGHDRELDKDSESVAFWLWTNPIIVPQIGGSTITVLVLESGRGDLNILFSIAVLLSSHVLYNGVGLLDDNRISELHCIRNLTRSSLRWQHSIYPSR